MMLIKQRCLSVCTLLGIKQWIVRKTQPEPAGVMAGLEAEDGDLWR